MKIRLQIIIAALDFGIYLHNELIVSIDECAHINNIMLRRIVYIILKNIERTEMPRSSSRTNLDG